MKLQWKTGVPFLAGLAISGFGVWKILNLWHFKWNSSGFREKVGVEYPSIGKSCEVEKDSAVASDPFMSGIIESGASYPILKNFYSCHPVESGDVVYYRFSSNLSPVPRIVRAVPGDQFKVLKDVSAKSWNIQINGKTLMYQGKPYFFGAEPPPALAQYERTFGGVLPQNVYILFSNVPPGELDSSNFGVMSLSDLIGKVDVRNRNLVQADH